jgi:hypothetical protein
LLPDGKQKCYSTEEFESSERVAVQYTTLKQPQIKFSKMYQNVTNKEISKIFLKVQLKSFEAQMKFNQKSIEKKLQFTANCKNSVRYLTNKINHTLHSKNDICSVEDFRGADIRLMSE